MHLLTCLRRWQAAAWMAAACAAHAAGEPSLADLSLEQLSNIEVTSISKRGQRLAEVAGSVYVIRGDDIRRAGATTLPEALRLAPNLFVARANATEYAITARTGADTLANKLLVLIDGRTVYSPLFSGVFWEAQDLVMEDIDRIEVLSGSGGTLYGSNAFHGVINVITRSADQTVGTLASVTAGTDQKDLSLRHGVASDGGGWRVWGKRSLFDRSPAQRGGSVLDAANRSLVGFRYDHGGAERQVTVQGRAFQHHAENWAGPREYRGLSLLARHATLSADGGRTQWQAYVDRVQLDRTSVADTFDTLDLDVQRLLPAWGSHLVLFGGGWRHMQDDASNTPLISLLPPRRTLDLSNVFVQDEWSLSAFKLTAGLKAEHNTYTGLEWLPNLRGTWDVAPGQFLWAAWSRVVRTPSRVDSETRSPPLQPSPDFRSEIARITELGYRGKVMGAASVSATLFHHDFERLRSVDLGPGGILFGNNYRGTLDGIEAWTELKPTTNWRLQAGGVHQRARYAAAPGTSPLPQSQGNDPRTRLNLNSYWDFRGGIEVFLGLRHVSALPQPAVSSYTGVDARIGWQATRTVELALLLRNLAGSHVEWRTGPNAAEVRRSALVQATLRY